MSDLDDFLTDDEGASKVIRKQCATALSPSSLPGLDLALNPYTRCGHGCVYCYAPYVMRTAPDDWSQNVQAKVNIPQVLARELPRKEGVIGLGTVTDPYQPAERELKLTRRCLEVMTRVPCPVSILTKSDLIIRDIDLLKRIEKVEVGLSINTISDAAVTIFEPCAPPPSARLAAVRALIAAGINAYVFLGPIIPTITDRDLPGLVRSIRATGADRIMVDRLNLRPGMRSRMEETILRREPGSYPDFQRNVASDEYYAGMISSIKRVCADSHIICQNAF
jgi:DNA repair photolyase